MRYKYVLLFLFFFTLQQSAKADFTLDQNCTAAFKAVFELRFPEAKRLIAEEKRINPDNGIVLLLENYMDYFYLLTSSNRADYEKYKDRRSTRLDALEDNDENSPYYMFTQADIYIQSAVLKAKFGDNTSAVFDMRKGRKLLLSNAEKFKDFIPNQKSIGWLNILIGAIPPSAKGIVGILGVKGDLPTGLKQLQRLRGQLDGTKYSFYKDEVTFIIALANIDILRNKDSYAQLMAMAGDMSEKSLLKNYLQGYIAFKTGHTDVAISKFTEAPQTSEYMDMPVITYWLANAKLCRMDRDADKYLLRFISENKGDSFNKDAYLKIAYCAFLKKDIDGYNNYLNIVRTRGSAADEKDKEALKEANDARPDEELLRARFYFDGGYYDKALAMLKAKQFSELKIVRDKTEYYYRFGRTYDAMENDTAALTNYQRAINLGKATSYYYAANSALLSGLIYEKKRDFKKAAEFFKQTLSMKNHEYQNSIDNQAKDGLSRIKAD
ncbi:tetratricopeptide repeat protein [Mucilaginibacter calamicampi]|uniref:Tetratricopeptide repeat protein n=1 Tax=Mucilaginibacter calamicampi TaxID=1302352 RepID=A0ABW2Z192_9SPHI